MHLGVGEEDGDEDEEEAREVGGGVGDGGGELGELAARAAGSGQLGTGTHVTAMMFWGRFARLGKGGGAQKRVGEGEGRG